MLDDGRIDKNEYKQAVADEKSKLFKQVIILTVLSAVISGLFYVCLMSSTGASQWRTQKLN